MKHFILALTLIAVVSVQSFAKGTTVSSPDGSLVLSCGMNHGKPFYSLKRHGESIVNNSYLGIQAKKWTLNDGMSVKSVQRTSCDETWTRPWGEEKTERNDYNGVILTLTQKSTKRQLGVEFRVFNDGIGFRYLFPMSLGDFTIMDELTEFAMPWDAETWSQPTNGVAYYESLYKKEPISHKDTISTPITMEVNDSLFIAIHEANLTDYASMNLTPRGDKHTTLLTALTPWQNGDKVRVSKTRVSPWRTIIVARTAGDLLLSRLELNLNEPCKIEDVSWIKPTKYVGIWWCYHLQTNTWCSGPRHGATTAIAKRYIDFAAKHGFGGVLVEGWNQGWDGDWTKTGDHFSFTKAYPDYDFEGLCKYANERGVHIIAHNETGGAAENLEKQMDKAFELYHSLGINTIKTGYVNAHFYNGELQHSQWGINHYRKVLECAAKHHIMVVNHEGAMPTGLSRTYPNLIGTEDMRGQEYNGWSPDGGNPPYHECILPFTRGLAGPMDYTPGIVNMENKAHPKTFPHTTVAKQLAEYIVLYSPGHMAADVIDNYKDNPALSWIESVGTNFSKTVVPHAKIGEYVTIARQERGTGTWFVGSMTDDKARALSLSLSFLDPATKYTAYIYADGPDADGMKNPYPLTFSKIKVNSSSVIPLNLAKSGGCAIRIVKEK